MAIFIKFYNKIPIKILKKSVTIKVLLQFLFLIYLCSILSNDLKNYRDQQIDNFKLYVPFNNIPKTQHKNDSIKYILMWTSWWFFENWQMGAKLIGEEYLRSVECPVINCIFSHNRSYLPQPTDYDALVFHVGDFISIDDLPEFRRDDQIYVMANEE